MHSDSDRDRTVEHLLRQSLKARAGSVSRGPCLEAETLAAWTEGALAGEELAAAQAHASDCSHCQAMLAAMARDDGARAIPSLAQDPASVGGRQARGPAHAWWKTPWRIGWLVPLTAAAAALVVWIAVPRHDDHRSIEQAPAQARADAPPSPKAAAPQPNESSSLAERKPASTLEAGKLQARADERPDLSRNKAEGTARPEATPSLGKRAALDRDRASDLRRPTADAFTSSPGVERRAQAAGETPRERPPTPAAEAPLTPRPLEAPAEGRAQARAAAPPAAVGGTGGANAVMSARETATNAAIAPAPVDILSPDRASRWRPGAAGSVQYSSDGGATWQPLATGVSADLTAGASPSASVCWIVGRAGTVLLSTDGRRWRRVTFPEAVDLTAVTATDASTATVTTADGRRFSTADGGVSWRQL